MKYIYTLSVPNDGGIFKHFKTFTRASVAAADFAKFNGHTIGEILHVPSVDSTSYLCPKGNAIVTIKKYPLY